MPSSSLCAAFKEDKGHLFITAQSKNISLCLFQSRQAVFVLSACQDMIDVLQLTANCLCVVMSQSFPGYLGQVFVQAEFLLKFRLNEKKNTFCAKLPQTHFLPEYLCDRLFTVSLFLMLQMQQDRF